MKGIQIGRAEGKSSLYVGDIILYREKPKESTQKLLDLINEFSIVAGCNINTYRNHLHFLTLIMISEKECKKRAFKTTPPKQENNLGIYLTKEVKGLCTESNKTLKKEIKENSKKWKDI